jgi:transposase
VAQSVLLDGVGSIEALLTRREDLEARMVALVPGSPWERQVARLRCLRGIDTLSALGLCVEVGDFDRFERPARLMSYLGLVPSENTTGEKRRQGSITKSGSRHARRLLVEAAWHYRNQSRVGREIEACQQAQPAEAVAIAWSAQRRLHRVWSRMRRRGKRSTVITVLSLASWLASAGRSPRWSDRPAPLTAGGRRCAGLPARTPSKQQ